LTLQMPWLFGTVVLNVVHVVCCTLRDQFSVYGEIVLKTIMIIICCHFFVTLLFVVLLNEGLGKLGP